MDNEKIAKLLFDISKSKAKISHEIDSQVHAQEPRRLDDKLKYFKVCQGRISSYLLTGQTFSNLSVSPKIKK